MEKPTKVVLTRQAQVELHPKFLLWIKVFATKLLLFSLMKNARERKKWNLRQKFLSCESLALQSLRSSFNATDAPTPLTTESFILASWNHFPVVCFQLTFFRFLTKSPSMLRSVVWITQFKVRKRTTLARAAIIIVLVFSVLNWFGLI